MAEAQVIFRLPPVQAARLDRTIRKLGFKTRSEWFRRQVRETLEEAGRHEALAQIEKLTVPGMTERRIRAMVRGWRRDEPRAR